MTPRELLNLPLHPGNDAGAPTVHEYLIKLLLQLWELEEGFNGKRPFGNSGWQEDIYGPMEEAGLISDSLTDYYGERRKADEMILDAIRELRNNQPILDQVLALGDEWDERARCMDDGTGVTLTSVRANTLHGCAQQLRVTISSMLERGTE